MSAELELIRPRWPAPASVGAAVTTRSGGVSLAPYDSLNLAQHVGDDADRVSENRRRLRDALALDVEPAWLEQVHGNAVVRLDGRRRASQADAAVAFEPGRVCAVLTADCLPVLLCDRAGERVGVAHAGWRGLAGGVIEAAVAALDRAPDELMAWLGPAIGPDAFEVGAEVRALFLARDPDADVAFRANARGRWQADLYLLARSRLARSGIAEIHGGSYCTWSESQRFYSYRRDGRCGRMASLIWLR